MSVTNIKHGVYGGLPGGVVFGAMMAWGWVSTGTSPRSGRPYRVSSAT